MYQRGFGDDAFEPFGPSLSLASPEAQATQTALLDPGVQAIIANASIPQVAAAPPAPQAPFDFGAWVKQYQTPLLIGAGGLVLLSLFRRR